MIVPKTPEQQARVQALKEADKSARRIAKDISAWLTWEDLPPNEFTQMPDYETRIRTQLLDLADHIFEATK